MSNYDGITDHAELNAIFSDSKKLRHWLRTDEFGLMKTFQRLLDDGLEGHALIAKGLTTPVEYSVYDTPFTPAHEMLGANAEYDKEMTKIVEQLSDEPLANLLSVPSILAWNAWACPRVKSFKSEDQLRVLSAGNAVSVMVDHDTKWLLDFLQAQTPQGKKSLLKSHGALGSLADHNFGIEALDYITDDYTADDVAHCLNGSFDALIVNGLGEEAIQLLKRSSIEKVPLIVRDAYVKNVHEHGRLDEFEAALMEIFPDAKNRAEGIKAALQEIQTLKDGAEGMHLIRS